MNTCLLPWSHMFYHSDGNVYPCCKLAGNNDFNLGKTTDDVNALWNSDKLKQLRLSFIKNTPTKECINHCFKGIQPLHIFVPDGIQDQKDIFFNNTSSDGHFEENFIIWNINESNLCNFKCSYCNLNYSSLFSKSSKILKSFNTVEEQLNLFKHYCHKIKSIIFASGESAFQPGYIDMLMHLKNEKILDIDINFITNFSVLKYKNINILDLLSNFKKVTLIASLDAFGAHAEYIRYGTKWSLIEQNRQELLNYPKINFLCQSVISNLNIFHLPDFHYNWFNKGYLNKDNVRYYMLSSPLKFMVNEVPVHYKEKINTKLLHYLKFLEDCSSETANCMTPYQKVKKIMLSLNKLNKLSIDSFYNTLNDLDMDNNINHRPLYKELYEI